MKTSAYDPIDNNDTVETPPSGAGCHSAPISLSSSCSTAWGEEDRYRAAATIEKTSWKVAGALQCLLAIVVLGGVWFVYWEHVTDYETHIATASTTHSVSRKGDDKREQQTNDAADYTSLEAIELSKNGGGKGRPTVTKGSGNRTSLPLAMYNDYTKDHPITWTHKWEYLAEPHRLTYIEAVCNDCNDDNFEWQVNGELIGNIPGNGRVTTYTFTELGYHTVTLTHTAKAATETVEVTGQVMVKYVRREIRNLEEDDRKRFLDALEVMYRVEGPDGRILYGESYKPMSYFISMHLDGAGTTECDGWHDDAGIVTNHVGVTLAVEQALQVIDPMVTIPYWDHTIDAEVSEDGTFRDSVIFHDDWFGENDPDNRAGAASTVSDDQLQHVVARGRWAYTPVLKDAWEHVHNPYGLLRSPWNTSPVPYLQRSAKTNGVVGFKPPTCSSFQMCYARPSFAAMQNCLNGGTHGPVHILIGGEWGLETANVQFMKDIAMGGKHPLLFKSLWRKGFLREPENCTDIPSEECKTSCPQSLLDDHGMSAYDVLLAVSQLDWLSASSASPVYWDETDQQYTYHGYEHNEDELEKIWSRTLEVLCETGTVGEMYTSAAPQDPTFWIIHPSMERFLGQKLHMADARWDKSWGYYHQNDPGDDGSVCDWSAVVDKDDLPRCTADRCFGHGEFDLRPFMLEINGKAMLLTNRQILDLIQPENDDLPYMYDNYEWPACDELGITFS